MLILHYMAYDKLVNFVLGRFVEEIQWHANQSFLFFLHILQGTADEVVHWSHGKQLWELSKEKYEPLWLNGGNHCNLEIYPEYLRHLKKFVSVVGKSKGGRNSSKRTKTDADDQNRNEPIELENTVKPHIISDLPELSRISLDSRIEKSKKIDKPEKSRMSTDHVDRYRRRKGLIW